MRLWLNLALTIIFFIFIFYIFYFTDQTSSKLSHMCKNVNNSAEDKSDKIFIFKNLMFRPISKNDSYLIKINFGSATITENKKYISGELVSCEFSSMQPSTIVKNYGRQSSKSEIESMQSSCSSESSVSRNIGFLAMANKYEIKVSAQNAIFRLDEKQIDMHGNVYSEILCCTSSNSSK